MATKKRSTRKSTAKKSTKTSRKKVGDVMREYKRGQLKSGGRRKVTSRKQAIAIGLSEAREAGAKIPRKGASKKRASTKKRAASKKRGGAKKRGGTKRASKKR
jgi:hypothetical protein